MAGLLSFPRGLPRGYAVVRDGQVSIGMQLEDREYRMRCQREMPTRVPAMELHAARIERDLGRRAVRKLQDTGNVSVAHGRDFTIVRLVDKVLHRSGAWIDDAPAAESVRYGELVDLAPDLYVRMINAVEVRNLALTLRPRERTDPGPVFLALDGMIVPRREDQPVVDLVEP